MREKHVADNKAGGLRTLKSKAPDTDRMWRYRVCCLPSSILVLFWFSISSPFPTSPFRNGDVYFVPLYVANTQFPFHCTGGHSKETALHLSRYFGQRSSAETVLDHGDFLSWAEYIFHYDVATSLWGSGREMWWFSPHKCMCLDSWSPWVALFVLVMGPCYRAAHHRGEALRLHGLTVFPTYCLLWLPVCWEHDPFSFLLLSLPPTRNTPSGTTNPK